MISIESIFIWRYINLYSYTAYVRMLRILCFGLFMDNHQSHGDLANRVVCRDQLMCFCKGDLRLAMQAHYIHIQLEKSHQIQYVWVELIPTSLISRNDA